MGKFWNVFKLHFRDRDVRSLDIFDEKAHPLTVSCLKFANLVTRGVSWQIFQTDSVAQRLVSAID